MDSYSNSSYGYNPNPSFQSDFKRLLDPFPHSVKGFNGVMLGGSALSHSLVLDSERGELVKAPTIVGKKGVSEEKALAALKSHSEAERRRRERINAHLTTLRGLVPCNERMDKATLLAEVISQLKELKKKAVETSQGFLIPMDADEVRVEPCDIIDGADVGTMSYKASLCCDYRPQLFSDLRKAIDSLQPEMAKAEISTLGSRVKNAFVFTCCKGGCINIEECQAVASNVHQALSSVLDKASAIPEYSPRTTHPSKRPRVSFFDTL
ncbi:hypothetical protein F2P56_006409 [Juglans regia]|uniref:BHLH domain-containing protein n=2 Tax=Juglans regia TaxID=51240 RepID=A0A834D4D3_JUGRE|nr:putative transcription factor bHLH107 [Juglans regia]KAF5474516.1 hypothetical protein F2P56_006409 [Juglans regia]